MLQNLFVSILVCIFAPVKKKLIMCTSLVSITPSVKLLPSNQGFGADINVPCGHCEECLQAKRREYEFRFAYEFDRLQKIGGRAIMLLLSFNQEHVAVVRPSDYGYHDTFNKLPSFFRTFDNDYLAIFKNRLRKAAWKRWGKACYRFFYAPEFGENSYNNPHYHVIYFLTPGVDENEFYDMVRSIWHESMNCGFVFPNYKEHRANDGSVQRFYYKVKNGVMVQQPILVRNLGGAAMYCAKYVTKQYLLAGCADFLDWYRSLPKVKRNALRRFIPRYSFSKSFGMQCIERENLTNLESLHKALTLGVVPPYFHKSVSLPKYILRALFYDNVKLGDVSPTTDKPLYTALPSSLLLDYTEKYEYYKLASLRPLAYQFLSVNKDIDMTFEELSKSFFIYHRYTCGSTIDERFADYLFNKLHPLEDSIIEVSGKCLHVESELCRDMFTGNDTYVERFMSWLDDISHTNMADSVKKAKYFYENREALL